MAEFWDKVVNVFNNIFSSPLLLLRDVLDISLIAIMIYFSLKFIRDKRAAQLLKGIVLFVALLYITKIFSLSGTYWILNKVLEFGVLAILIVFQPELRSVLEAVGRKGFKLSKLKRESNLVVDENVVALEQFCNAVDRLSKTKTGALIVFEKETKLGEIIKTGIGLDSSIVSELMCNIFFNKAPLHDGAVIIRNFKIIAAGCFLPLSTKAIASDLGTRHRAAIGMSEVSDAVVVIVSEETGIISVASEGNLRRNLTPDELLKRLKKEFIQENEEKKTFSLSKSERRKSNEK